MLNKNIANYTNFELLHTNKKIIQAPGGNSSINLTWINNNNNNNNKKINHHQSVQQYLYHDHQYQGEGIGGRNYSENYGKYYQYSGNGNQGNGNVYKSKNNGNQDSFIGNSMSKHGSYNNSIQNNCRNQQANENPKNVDKKWQQSTIDYNYISKKPSSISYLPDQTYKPSHNYSYTNKHQDKYNNKNKNMTIDYTPPYKNRYDKLNLQPEYKSKNLQEIDIAIDQQYHTNKNNYGYNHNKIHQQNLYHPVYQGHGYQQQRFGLRQNYNQYVNNQNQQYKEQELYEEKITNNYNQNNFTNYMRELPRTSVKVHYPPGGKQTLKLY